VDGITATCVLTQYLRGLGARVTSYIPARMEEGYGLNESAIRTLQAEGVTLIVTVDCGITACEEAALCRRLGISLVITDHHECKEELPEAEAVVDPHRRDQPEPRPELAGVGVAFKLAAALAGDQQALLEQYCDLLCLGTVADVMPLAGENRAVVARGLRELQNPRRVGIAALMAECAGKSLPVTAGTIGYTLAPRINAAGRMGEVDVATELFLTDDPARAAELAARLCQLNRQRQEIECGIYRDALAMLPPGQMPKAIVLADESWHQGVVGIVASRLAEEYSCPTFLICLDGDKGKASSRSYGGFNLFQSLETLSPLLESYGGHELAAGFTIRRDRIAQFREQIMRLTDEFTKTDACHLALPIDCEIPMQLLTLANIEALDELEPCGAGCPRPVLNLRGLTVDELTEVGGGKHLRLRLSQGPQQLQRDLLLDRRAPRRRGAGRPRGDRVHAAGQRVPRPAQRAAQHRRHPARLPDPRRAETGAGALQEARGRLAADPGRGLEAAAAAAGVRGRVALSRRARGGQLPVRGAGLSQDSIVASLLHDVIEDTPLGYDDIAKKFGGTVADLVEGVTKLTRVQYTSKEDEQMENMRKMLLAMTKDIRVILIKIADRLHNMRTMAYQSRGKAAGQVPGDHGDLRAAGPPAGHAEGQVGAGGSGAAVPGPRGYKEITDVLDAKMPMLEDFMAKVQKQMEAG
jgi:single-stranded-DNA-specific exonuclease RecJ